MELRTGAAYSKAGWSRQTERLTGARRRRAAAWIAAPIAAAICVTAATAADDDLAKKIANPISDLISVPFQFNYDKGYGPSNGGRFTLNIQPVMPVKLNEDWNVIVRTIVPLINQEERLRVSAVISASETPRRASSSRRGIRVRAESSGASDRCSYGRPEHRRRCAPSIGAPGRRP